VVIGRIRWNEKYRTVNNCPIIMKGSSTGRPPIHVRISHVATSDQNRICVGG